MDSKNIALSELQKNHTQKGFMKAAMIAAPGNIELVSIHIPEPGPDEVRVKIEGCGICGSDLPVWQGREWFQYPILPGGPGHEGYGFIEALGKKVTNFKIGDRVAMLSYHAYAEYDIAKANEVIKLPPSMDSMPFPAEPLGCAMNIFKRSNISKRDIVAIIGAGFIGNLLIQLSKACGANVIAISKRDTSLKMAYESGADHIIKLDDHYEIIKKVMELTNNGGCSKIIEATGKQWPLDLAGDIIATRGTLIIAGFHQDGLRQINLQNWNWKGIDVINAHERDPKEYINGMKEAVTVISSKIIKPSFLYTHEFQLDQINEAFNLMNSRNDGVLKIIIKNKF